MTPIVLGMGTDDAMNANGTAVVLLVGRFESTCGACNKPAWPHDKAHDRVCGYTPGPGCGAVWTHVLSTYPDERSIAATKTLRPDLTYGVPDDVEPAP